MPATADSISKRGLQLHLPQLMCDGTLSLFPQDMGLSLHHLNLGIPGPPWLAALAKRSCVPLGTALSSLAAHFLFWKQRPPKKSNTTCWGSRTIFPVGSPRGLHKKRHARGALCGVPCSTCAVSGCSCKGPRAGGAGRV